ncbi:CDP-glycerol glycerophosphotransferase family protein [Microlunatus flavus]|uniref:CDP-glycerol glycerophosphotransferase n=1 Tax=Microlunatus flavus TaxID=1036181 RepID=A0A1H8ZLM2_9ACTN|nr:CDP-glycerol glycerophosphotransferase family protein [Microlunatus flavus]SEP65197.1 CDP-glycerol glycerophosphotransferase [Microlunatus flavus]
MKIVYNAFNGRYADSPRALHQGLLARGVEAEHVWLQDERFVGGFPAGVATVPIGTPTAVAALESADVLISNTHIQLDRWQKPAGAFYLQTWHGTPLKQIHRAAASIPPEEMMVELDLDIARWDALVSQSPAATGLLRTAFGYAGPVMETGYPRNDVLSAPDAARRRAELREELGIGDDVTAVLYAPTYRDDTVDEADAPDGLDLEQLVRRLGPGRTVLLRQHYYLYRRPVRTGLAGLVDVSDNPDIADLYLAADAMVTDYSSAMFDFAVTGKPLLLHPYDLEHYRDQLRGFTFDLDTEGPGELVLDPAVLAEKLLALPATSAEDAVRYAAFRRRWCGLDDGHATDRVLDQLLELILPSTDAEPGSVDGRLASGTRWV